MMKNKTIMTSVIAAIAITSIALVLGLSETQNTSAVPQGNNVYVFAEGVSPRATFTFNDGMETSDFVAFTQVNGNTGTNGRSTAPEFTLVKVPGSTPLLYKAADEILKKGGNSNIDSQINRFSVRVDLNQAGQPVRSFEYERCEVTSYKVYTEYDKEEGYVTGGKTGFALQDEFRLLCSGMIPIDPTTQQSKTNQ